MIATRSAVPPTWSIAAVARWHRPTMDKIYADFEIWISAASMQDGLKRTYLTLVVSSPAGSASSALTIDWGNPAWLADLVAVGGIDPDLPRRRGFGQRLFNALFADGVHDVWRESCGRIDAAQADGLRIRLWMDAPDLVGLPWELLCDPHDDGFLALSASHVLTRYLRVPEAPTLEEHDRLRVLLVVERPAGVPEIKDADVQQLEAAIRGVGPSIDLTTIDTPIASEIEQALQQDHHIFHFLGHGAPGKIVMKAPPGLGRTLDVVDEQRFATLFRGRRATRLVVLTACASADAGEGVGTVFDGIGPALIRARVPAVVAMQYPTVQADTAAVFSRAFYEGLASGFDVDAAVNKGRNRIAVGGLLDGRDWSTPVLYVGTRSGQLFNLAGARRPVEKHWDAVRAQIGEDSRARTALDALSTELRTLADTQRGLAAVVELNQLIEAVNASFLRVRRLVEEAQGNGPNLRLNEVKDRWREFRDGPWRNLATFGARHAEVDISSWYPALETAVTQVQDAVQREARRPIAETVVFEMDAVLARAAAEARADEADALRQIISMSDRTLGRLPSA